MAAPNVLPEIAHYITTLDPEGKSTYINATNPPPACFATPSSRLDYVYSASGSAADPILKDDADYKEHQVVLGTTPQTIFPLAGSSSAIFAPNPSNGEGFMHRINTLDYIFVINGEPEPSLDSGEKRRMKSGDVCILRASMHSWKNVRKTDLARIGVVYLGIEGATLNGMLFPEQEKE